MREFTDDKIELFELVSISDKYRIEGSSDIEKIINYGDVDLLDIAKKKQPKDILVHFLGVFEEVDKLSDVVITDFKCGKKKGTALRWTRNDLKSGSNNGVSFDDALKMESTIKLDVVANLNDRFLEITTVYDFGDNYVEISDKAFIDDIVSDYRKQIKTKNYFKALKRIFLIMKVTDKKNKLLIKFIEYFNTPIGLLYRLKSDLETTLLVIDHFNITDIKTNLDNIKESLSSFKIKNLMIDIKTKTKKQISVLITNQIKIVNDELNADVKKFMKLHKL